MTRGGRSARPGAGGPTSLTFPFDPAGAQRLAEVLDALGCEAHDPPQHARLAAKGDGVRLVLYTSGKLLLQGKGASRLREELAAFGLVEGAAPPEDAQPTVGSDECGKGDFFGPLVVAAAYVDPDTAARLAEAGVQDSKRISDPRILTLSAEVARRCPHEVVSVSPTRYNELYEQFQNLNRMLAWAHGRALERVLEQTGCGRVVVDRFAKDDRVVGRALGPLGKKAHVIQRPRAESEPAVAAASILARARFVRDLDRLSERAGMTLPKGAAPQVERAGRELVRAHGAQALGDYAKLHFRTAARVLG
jgi:ribonuclease HIII